MLKAFLHPGAITQTAQFTSLYIDIACEQTQNVSLKVTVHLGVSQVSYGVRVCSKRGTALDAGIDDLKNRCA
jgi:hypothetical protein